MDSKASGTPDGETADHNNDNIRIVNFGNLVAMEYNGWEALLRDGFPCNRIKSSRIITMSCPLTGCRNFV